MAALLENATRWKSRKAGKRALRYILPLAKGHPDTEAQEVDRRALR